MSALGDKERRPTCIREVDVILGTANVVMLRAILLG